MQSDVGIDSAHLKTNVLEQSEQRRVKRQDHISLRDQTVISFVGHGQDFISARVKAIGGFVQFYFISALPFVSLIALLRMDSRKTKVETGEHLGNLQ